MTYKGTVRGGVVVLEATSQPPPEGATVEIIFNPDTSPAESGQDDNRTWGEIFRSVIGTAKTLPEDASYQHDHYLYGTPKKR